MENTISRKEREIEELQEKISSDSERHYTEIAQLRLEITQLNSRLMETQDEIRNAPGLDTEDKKVIRYNLRIYTG